MSVENILVLCWNYRGAGNRSFSRNIKEMMWLCKPGILSLLEPRNSKEIIDGVCKRKGRKNWFRVEADGFSGGIWLLWNKDEVESWKLLVSINNSSSFDGS